MEESYEKFSLTIHELTNRVETVQNNLINAERMNDKERFNVCFVEIFVEIFFNFIYFLGN